LFLYIFWWLLLFVEGMYRMRKTAIGPPPKTYSIGKKSRVVYSDTDESDTELGPVFIRKTHHKPNVKETSSVIHSETSAAKEYAKRGIKYPGGQKKTRRARKSRRQTKRR
jgi:hypothetical protein